MPVVRGCTLPDELLHDIANHTRHRDMGDGTTQMGMAMVATALAGQLVAFTPKKVGRAVQAGQSCATVESGKWVGPAKSVADPYKAWLVQLRLADWANVKTGLTPGASVAAPYEVKMAADGFADCAP